MKIKKQDKQNIWEVLLNLSIFGFMGSVAIVFTSAFQSHLQNLPLLFEFFYIIGIVYFMILSLTIN